MPLLDRLRGRRENQISDNRQDEPPACRHATLVPRWDSVEDMGNEAKVSEYACGACGAEFTVDEGRGLIATEAERVRQTVADN